MMFQPHGRANKSQAFSSVFMFFRVILEETLQGNKLLLPKKFVRKYGETLSSTVSVELPGGSEWKIELSKWDGNIWFEKGWTEFAKHYSLQFGHLLIFIYEGNSQFQVYICDKSTCQIDEASIPDNLVELEPHTDGELKVSKRVETKEDDSVQVLEDLTPCFKTTDRSTSPFSQPQKRIRTSPEVLKKSSFYEDSDPSYPETPCSKTNDRSPSPFSWSQKRIRTSHEVLKKSRVYEDSDHSIAETKGKLDFPVKEKSGDKPEANIRSEPLTKDEKTQALQRASSGFKSENPVLMIVMQQSHLFDSYHMGIPLKFLWKHLNYEYTSVNLQISNGGTWPVMVKFRKCRLGMRAAFDQKGWKKFALDNSLEVGDVCIFELITVDKISFQVSISRALDPTNAFQPKRDVKLKAKSQCSGDDEPSINPLTENEVETNKFSLGHLTQCPSSSLRDTVAFEAAEKFSSEQPFFKVIVGKKSSVLRLPNDFVKSHIDQKAQTVTLKVGNRSWLVKLLRSSSGYYLSGGFSKFARQTSLSPGDVCIYELTERNQVVLKVSIFRFTVVT